MIRGLNKEESQDIAGVINKAARMFEPVALSYHHPFVDVEKVYDAPNITYFGYFADDGLVGVMALQDIDPEIALIRSAYILPDFQRQGIGQKMLRHLESLAKLRGKKTLLVGTYSGASWALDFYIKNGFSEVEESQDLLKKYWSQITVHHRKESVVLKKEL